MESSSNDATVTLLKSFKDVLSSVPLGICSLGQVMLTASKAGADVSINSPPIGGFKHITSPGRLSNTLRQIYFCGFGAITAAHSGMFALKCCTNLIQSACADAEKIMRNATPQNKSSMDLIVRFKLESIEKATKRGQDESEKMVKDLKNLLDLVEETLKAYFNSKTARERLQEDNQKKEKELQEKKKVVQREKLRNEKEQEEYEEQLKSNREEQKNAGEALPSPWARISAYALNAIGGNFGVEYENNLGLTFDRFKLAAETSNKIDDKIEQVRKEWKSLHRENLDINIQLIELDFKKVSCDDDLKMSQEAVELITLSITHWKKLQELFQHLNHSVKHLLGEKLDHLNLSQPDHSLMSEDVLKLLKSASQQSYQIGCFCKFYAEISMSYLIPTISTVGKFIAVNPEQIEEVKKKLTADAQKAHESIVEAIKNDEEINLLSKMKAEN